MGIICLCINFAQITTDLQALAPFAGMTGNTTHTYGTENLTHHNSSDSSHNGTDGSGSGSGSGHGSGHSSLEEHAVHSTAHTTILFILIAVVAGCAIQHFSSRYLKTLPFSPAVFVFGILLAVIDKFMLDGDNELHESISRWQEIDGHLLLNIFLPPLLMAESIHLDWHVAKRSASQCIILAFPGVVLGTFLTAVYSTNVLPYDWSASLAWSFGAVLAATDPVAVVSMLKELGAPASITMIISGESLLNDGSAMVIWRFFFELYLGSRSLDGGGLILFLIQLAVGGAALGLAFGFLSLYWLSLASHKLEHTDVIVQVVLTIVLSYCCYYTCENIAQVSGVLAVVVQGTFLSATFWPIVASRQTMEHVWHTVEWVYTVLLFSLAGLIVGGFIVNIENCEIGEAETDLCLSDLPWVFVTYVAVVVIRLITLLALLPILRRLGYGLSLPGVLVCTWGGLRGAVGLALALSMQVDLLGSRDGKLVVLQVAGVALLTLLVNAPLSPALLSYLRLAKPTETKRRLLLDMERRVHSYALEQYLDLIKKDEWKLHSEEWESKLVEAITSLSKAVEERAKKERVPGLSQKHSRAEIASLMRIAAEQAERSKKSKMSVHHKTIAEKAYSSLHLPHLHSHFPNLHLRAPHLHLHLPHMDPHNLPQIHLPQIHMPHLHLHLPNLQKRNLPTLSHIPHPHLHLPNFRFSHHTSTGGMVLLDVTGDGLVDSIGFDTNGDGKLDMIGFDTTGDGKLDTVGFDSNGDGIVDTLKKVSPEELPQHLPQPLRPPSNAASTPPRKPRGKSLARAIASPGAVPIDVSGNGVFDSVGFDTNGDGKVDLVKCDTTGDGRLDTIALDAGDVVTCQPIPASMMASFGSEYSEMLEAYSVEAPSRRVATGPSVLEAASARGAVPLDATGDGIIDSVGFDTDGDGKVDMVGFDTTGDGRLDTLGFDTNGDGMVDSLEPLPPNFDVHSFAASMYTPPPSRGSSRVQVEDGRAPSIFLLSVVTTPGAVPLDAAGTGIIDSVGFDTNGDGRVDMVGFDTTGDGKLDMVGFDSNGDGRVDTLKPITHDFDLTDLKKTSKNLRRSSIPSLNLLASMPSTENARSVQMSPLQAPLPHVQQQSDASKKMKPKMGTIRLKKVNRVSGKGLLASVTQRQDALSDGSSIASAEDDPATFSLPAAVMQSSPPSEQGKKRPAAPRPASSSNRPSNISTATSPNVSSTTASPHLDSKEKQQRPSRLQGLAQALEFDQAAHLVDARLNARVPNTTKCLSEDSGGTNSPSKQDMHQAAIRVQAALRGRQERMQIEHTKKVTHSHRLLHVRFIFLHVLKRVYLSFVEDGIVPARSLLAHDLTNSVDMAVDHLGLPLFDWAVIVQDVIRLPWYKRIWLSKDAGNKSDTGNLSPVTQEADAWDGVRFHSPNKMLGLASTIAAKVAKKRRAWHSKVPKALWRLTSWFWKATQRLVQQLRLDTLLLRLNLTHYDEHAVYVLRCFILAHEEAQRELRADLTADDASDVRAEVIEVIQESQLAVHEARRYLRQLTSVSQQRGFADLVESVRSRQLAGLILSRLEAFVHRMMERGALDERDAQQLMHEFAADEERIQRKGAKMFVPDKSLKERSLSRPVISNSHADAVAELQRIHVSGQKRLRQLQLLTKATIAFKQKIKEDDLVEESSSRCKGNLGKLAEESSKRSPILTRRMKSALKASLPMPGLAVKHDSLARLEKQSVNEVDRDMLQEASRHSRAPCHSSLLNHHNHSSSYSGGLSSEDFADALAPITNTTRTFGGLSIKVPDSAASFSHGSRSRMPHGQICTSPVLGPERSAPFPTFNEVSDEQSSSTSKKLARRCSAPCLSRPTD
ncbi:hypothetical protein AB1Y20_015027 [Prymnesium parvum]|uniref:Cation/H+ exchanger transmembrane domain-containing protein n=1 Tax=Prymnesium parvum TaxID=97485 RepID=A0AB34JX88_PRYPA